MNNEPVAWVVQYKDKHDFTFYKPVSHDDAVVVPLYTHPAKEQDEPNWKEMYWWMHELNHKHWSELDALKTHPAKTLTDEEIRQAAVECGAYINEDTGGLYPDDMCVGSFARAILRKAQEK